jgi:hypothetical protein
MAKMGCAKCGGTKYSKGGTAPKKMAKGGNILSKPAIGKAKVSLFGMPQENMGTSGQYGKMQTGGSSRAVQPSCRNGMVRSAEGRCVNQRPSEFKKGGSTFGMLSVKAGIDKNPRPTAADRIAGAKRKK